MERQEIGGTVFVPKHTNNGDYGDFNSRFLHVDPSSFSKDMISKEKVKGAFKKGHRRVASFAGPVKVSHSKQ